LASQDIAWPKKAREIVSSYFDSTRWNVFEARDGDIVIATWGKSGTTWMQQIVAQLVLGPDAGLVGGGVSPWLDMRTQPFEPMLAALESQTHRRFIKTHLPLDALVFSPKLKYIYVGRDARDIIWSLYNHVTSYTDGFLDALNSPPGLPGQPVVRPECDVREFYLQFLETGEATGFSGFPSLWRHTQDWWNARSLPNVLLVHFANLKADLRGEMERIADFIDIGVKPAAWPTLVERCGFEHMKREAAAVDSLAMTFNGGGNTFIHKGTNGRWKDVLSAEEIARCDEVAAKHLTPECAHWLKTGELPKERKDGA
jgi:aryl sulfotransferase